MAKPGSLEQPGGREGQQPRVGSGSRQDIPAPNAPSSTNFGTALHQGNSSARRSALSCHTSWGEEPWVLCKDGWPWGKAVGPGSGKRGPEGRAGGGAEPQATCPRSPICFSPGRAAEPKGSPGMGTGSPWHPLPHITAGRRLGRSELLASWQDREERNCSWI